MLLINTGREERVSTGEKVEVGGGGGGGADSDVKVRIGRARAAFPQMKNIWDSPHLTNNIKSRTFNTTVKPLLLEEVKP